MISRGASDVTGQRDAYEYPLWVISGHQSGNQRCPLYPRKRTCSASKSMSALCQKRTSTTAAERGRWTIVVPRSMPSEGCSHYSSRCKRGRRAMSFAKNRSPLQEKTVSPEDAEALKQLNEVLKQLAKPAGLIGSSPTACPRLPEDSGPDYFAFASIRSLAAGPDEAGFWPVISWPSATV
jgi:hypothetical protein